MKRRVVVFGSTGFVGTNVLHALEFVPFRAGHPKLVVTAAGGQRPFDLTATGLRGNGLRAFLGTERPDFIINCAAHVGSLKYVTDRAARVLADNSRMILGLYEAVADACPRAVIVNPIANCAYPAGADTFVEDDWWKGLPHRSVLSYGVSRRLLWAASECFAMQFGVRSVSLLVPNMYGPHDSPLADKAHALNALAAKLVKAHREAAPRLDVWGTGVAIREWLYAPDFGRLVAEIVSAHDLPLGLDEPVNVAQNFGLSVRELVGILRRHVPFEGEVVFDGTMPDGAPRKVMDDRRFRKVFPEFGFTPLEDGLRETVKHYEGRYPF